MTHDTTTPFSWRDESELGKQMAQHEAEQSVSRNKRLQLQHMSDRQPHHKKPRARKALPPNCEAVLDVLRDAKEPIPARDLYEPTGLRQYEVNGALNTLKNRKLVRVAGTMPMGEGSDGMHRLDLVNTYEVAPEGGNWGRTR